MCGRYVLAHPEALQLRFDLAASPANVAASYNVAPGQEHPVIVEADGQRAARLMRWGLIPGWAKEASIGNRMINARAEGVAEKPAFRSAFRRRRCLVPAEGFYEWRKEGSRKQPYFIHPQDGELVAFAGLWDTWLDPQVGEIASYTIITTTPNAVVAPLHDRMPVILPRDAEGIWLDAGLHDTELLRALLRPAPDRVLAAHPVSAAINRPTGAGAALIAPL